MLTLKNLKVGGDLRFMSGNWSLKTLQWTFDGLRQYMREEHIEGKTTSAL